MLCLPWCWLALPSFLGPIANHFIPYHYYSKPITLSSWLSFFRASNQISRLDFSDTFSVFIFSFSFILWYFYTLPRYAICTQSPTYAFSRYLFQGFSEVRVPESTIAIVRTILIICLFITSHQQMVSRLFDQWKIHGIYIVNVANLYTYIHTYTHKYIYNI